MQKKLLEEYASILKKYMDNFGLETIDVSYLSDVNEKTINALLGGNGGIELDSLEAISLIFNLHYFQLGDPDFIIPELESLPEKTIKRIDLRKEVGPHVKTKNKKRMLNEKIIIILDKYFTVEQEFISKDICKKLIIDFKEQVTTSEVTTRLKGSLKELVLIQEIESDTDPKVGRQSNRCRLVKKIPEDVLAKAKNNLEMNSQSNFSKPKSD